IEVRAFGIVLLHEDMHIGPVLDDRADLGSLKRALASGVPKNGRRIEDGVFVRGARRHIIILVKGNEDRACARCLVNLVSIDDALLVAVPSQQPARILAGVLASRLKFTVAVSISIDLETRVDVITDCFAEGSAARIGIAEIGGDLYTIKGALDE